MKRFLKEWWMENDLRTCVLIWILYAGCGAAFGGGFAIMFNYWRQ